jgi:hypothetical protein
LEEQESKLEEQESKLEELQEQILRLKARNRKLVELEYGKR